MPKLYAELRGIDTHCSEPRVRRPPRRLEDMLVLEPTGSRQVATCVEPYKVDLCFPVLDSFLAEINCRFTTQNIELMKALQVYSPDSNNFLDPDCLTPSVMVSGQLSPGQLPNGQLPPGLLPPKTIAR